MPNGSCRFSKQEIHISRAEFPTAAKQKMQKASFRNVKEMPEYLPDGER